MNNNYYIAETEFGHEVRVDSDDDCVHGKVLALCPTATIAQALINALEWQEGETSVYHWNEEQYRLLRL